MLPCVVAVGREQITGGPFAPGGNSNSLELDPKCHTGYNWPVLYTQAASIVKQML